MKDRSKSYHTGWLWGTALIILIIGMTITYLFSRESFNPLARKAMILSLGVTIIGAGICLISATSDWWIHK